MADSNRSRSQKDVIVVGRMQAREQPSGGGARQAAFPSTTEEGVSMRANQPTIGVESRAVNSAGAPYDQLPDAPVPWRQDRAGRWSAPK
jgi:hypothetical protein